MLENEKEGNKTKLSKNKRETKKGQIKGREKGKKDETRFPS